MKSITFYGYEPEYHRPTHAWNATEYAITSGKETIETTQMGLLSTKLFELSYRVFIVDSFGDSPVEICLGKNTSTTREIRLGHNLFKMWTNGEFKG